MAELVPDVTADALIRDEIARQDRMWGAGSPRSDVGEGQLMCAAMAQLEAVYCRQNGETQAFDAPPPVYPAGWTGFRSYGGDVPNLVVAAAFLRQEIARKLAAGEDPTRLSRDPVAQPYTGLTPSAIEP